LTEREKTKTTQQEIVNREFVERLVEDIRLSALNIAVTASKLSIEGESRVVIRRRIGELVNLSLDTVNHLAMVMKKMSGESHEGDLDPGEHLAEVRKIEQTINRKVAEIAQLLADSGMEIP